jgi:hypothetical protein
MEAALLPERPDLLGRQLAFGRPAALALGPGPGGPGGGPGGVPLLAAHGVERVVHPLDHVEGVHDPTSRWGQRRLTSCLIHLAPSAVTTSMARLCSRVSSSRNRLSTSLPVPSCAQTRPAAVVVDDHRDVLVALLVRRLVDADAAHAVEPRGAARGLQLGVDAPAHAAPRCATRRGRARRPPRRCSGPPATPPSPRSRA